MSEQDEQRPRPGQKGGPSPNPAGRRGKLAVTDDFAVDQKPRKGKPAGTDGIRTIGGFLVQTERNHKLVGTEKWVTYDNLVANVAIVAAAVRTWLDLAGSVRWYAEPNKLGGAKAEACAELHNDVLFAGGAVSPWRKAMKRQALKKFRGFAMHEMVPTLRSDGAYGVDLQHRPQWTIWRWNKPDEQQPWNAVEQMTRMGTRYGIDRGRLFYSVEDTLTDSPDGVGLFRHLVEPQKTLEEYLRLEGIAFSTDMRGMIVARAPLAKLAREAVTVGGVAEDDVDGIRAYVLRQTSFLTDIVENHVITKNRGAMLDSTPYFGADVDGSTRTSTVYEWAIETVKAVVGIMPELAGAIDRELRNMARVLNAEHMLMGDSEGARAVHEDKTALMGLVINALLDDLADDASRDVAPALTAWNGYDRDTCTPRYCHEPVPTASVKEAAETLALIAKAALHPKDEAPDKLRERLELPPTPKDENGEPLPMPKPAAPSVGIDPNPEAP